MADDQKDWPGRRVGFADFTRRIADRMGQYASGSAPEMLVQARALFSFCEGLDLAYIERRISEETGGDHGLRDLQAKA